MSHFPAKFATDLARSCGLVRKEFDSIDYCIFANNAPVRVISMNNPKTEKRHTSLDFEFGVHGVETDFIWREILEQIEKLETFQKIAVASDFDLCRKLFGKLKKTQLDILELIHELTYPWLKGELFDVLIKRANNPENTNRDIASIASVILQAQNNSTIEQKREIGVTKSFYMDLHENSRKYAELN